MASQQPTQQPTASTLPAAQSNLQPPQTPQASPDQQRTSSSLPATLYVPSLQGAVAALPVGHPESAWAKWRNQNPPSSATQGSAVPEAGAPTPQWQRVHQFAGGRVDSESTWLDDSGDQSGPNVRPDWRPSVAAQ